MTDSAKPKTGWFKAKWLIFAVIVTIAMFALMGWHVFNTFQVSRTVQEAYVRGEKLRDQICRLHQEQMLSLAMLVATNSTTWERRYEEIERKLYSAIQHALSDNQPGYNMEALASLKEAHERLRERGNRAIELARVGYTRQALGMLTAPKYERPRNAFSEQTDLFIQDYRKYLSTQLLGERDRELISLVVAFFIFAISLSVWIILVRRLDRHQAEMVQEIGERTSAEQELRQLAGHLQSVREHERSAIAREIHDEMGQSLTALKIDLVRLRKRIQNPDKAVADLLEASLQALNETINSVQRILSELRPSILDHVGLIAAIEWQANEFQEHSGIKCTLSAAAQEPELNKEEKTALFRILQESLTNVARHANATEVRIDFSVENSWLVLSVTDNGSGISDWQARSGQSYGLMGMRERAHVFGGQLDIDSHADRGTAVRVRIPARPANEKEPD